MNKIESYIKQLARKMLLESAEPWAPVDIDQVINAKIEPILISKLTPQEKSQLSKDSKILTAEDNVGFSQNGTIIMNMTLLPKAKWKEFIKLVISEISKLNIKIGRPTSIQNGKNGMEYIVRIPVLDNQLTVADLQKPTKEEPVDNHVITKTNECKECGCGTCKIHNVK